MYTGGEDKTVKLWDMKLDNKIFLFSCLLKILLILL